MAARSLNKVQLIGNLTRDPELRYTSQGTAICTFGVATNREWTTESGEKRDEADFHNVVAWNKLAELCSQLLNKGIKVFVEGRLSTRSWTGQDGVQRKTTEIVISDMIILTPKGSQGDGGSYEEPQEETPPDEDASESSEPRESQEATESADVKKAEAKKKSEAAGKKAGKKDEKPEEVNPDDIPF